MKKIVIAGANGFMGRCLSRYFMAKSWQVIGLARRKDGLADGVTFAQWDGVSLGGWKDLLDGAEILVNLAGRTVNCRYNEKNKNQIIYSRVSSTKVLGEAVRACANPPKVWMNSSTATIYRHAEDHAQTESEGELGKGFSVSVAKAWEKAFFDAEVSDSVRKIALRTAIVMSDEEGTVMDVLTGLAKKRLGGKMGSGKQKVSWVGIDDVCRVVEWMYENENAKGVYNVAAPNAMTNAEMMKSVRGRAGVKWGLPATKWMLEIGAFFLRTETELILKSRWVYPERLLDEGFKFERERF